MHAAPHHVRARLRQGKLRLQRGKPPKPLEEASRPWVSLGLDLRRPLLGRSALTWELEVPLG